MQDEHGAGAPDPALAALTALCAGVQESVEELQHVLDRAEVIRRERERGRSWAQVAAVEDGPLIVERISATMARLSDAGSRWRREEALALHREGLSMDRIAGLFNVSRQRVSALLRAARASEER